MRNLEEMIVVTTTYITENNLPILEVSVDDDEEGGELWQFHAGNNDYSLQKLQLVKFETILGIDSSIKEVMNMKIGSKAVRESKLGQWIFS